MECHQCCVQKLVQAFAEADLERGMGRCQSKRLKEACTKLQEAFQNVCLTCVDEVNDNNPSNHGQTFYSLDSGHCQSSSGRSATSHSDTNEVISRADWINSHANYDSAYYQDNSFRPYAGKGIEVDFDNTPSRGLSPSTETPMSFQDEFSLTDLPSSVETIILRELNNFAALPHLHKMLIGCLLAGINISDFSRMGWLPKEIKRVMPPRGKDDPPLISAQTAHAIYQNICKKLPYMTVLARATKKRSQERISTQNAAIKRIQSQNKKALEYLSTPEKLKTIGTPKVDPHVYGFSSETSLAVAEKAISEIKKARRAQTKAHKEYLNSKYLQDTFALF